MTAETRHHRIMNSAKKLEDQGKRRFSNVIPLIDIGANQVKLLQ